MPVKPTACLTCVEVWKRNVWCSGMPCLQFGMTKRAALGSLSWGRPFRAHSGLCGGPNMRGQWQIEAGVVVFRLLSEVWSVSSPGHCAAATEDHDVLDATTETPLAA